MSKINLKIDKKQKRLINMLIGLTNQILLPPLPKSKTNIWIEQGFSCGDGWGDNLEESKNITQKSQTVMAGIHMILGELGVDFTLKLRKDKPNIVAFNLGEKYPVNKGPGKSRRFV